MLFLIFWQVSSNIGTVDSIHHAPKMKGKLMLYWGQCTMICSLIFNLVQVYPGYKYCLICRWDPISTSGGCCPYPKIVEELFNPALEVFAPPHLSSQPALTDSQGLTIDFRRADVMRGLFSMAWMWVRFAIYQFLHAFEPNIVCHGILIIYIFA